MELLKAYQAKEKASTQDFESVRTMVIYAINGAAENGKYKTSITTGFSMFSSIVQELTAAGYEVVQDRPMGKGMTEYTTTILWDNA